MWYRAKLVAKNEVGRGGGNHRASKKFHRDAGLSFLDTFLLSLGLNEPYHDKGIERQNIYVASDFGVF